jgi:hypothetical protein
MVVLNFVGFRSVALADSVRLARDHGSGKYSAAFARGVLAMASEPFTGINGETRSFD